MGTCELYGFDLKTMKFNTHWIRLQKSEFDRESTVPKKFYKHDGEAVNVDMMSRLGYFHYGKFGLIFDNHNKYSDSFDFSWAD